MCGLVGVAGRIGKLENRAFQDLLQIDVIRGPDSTGIAVLDIQNNSKVFKKAVLPVDLFQLKGCKHLFDDGLNRKILLGHNRWATRGRVTNINAHPFEFDTIIGAHNGTLRNSHVLADHMKFDVDSEALFHSFEVDGFNETIRKINGALALSWFDTNGETLSFFRNDERPLFYTFSKDGKSFYWASEDWMLSGVLARNGIDHNDILEFKENNQYILKFPEKINDVFEEFTMTQVETYTPPKPVPRQPQRVMGGVQSSVKKPLNGSKADETCGNRVTLSDHKLVGKCIYFRIPAQNPQHFQRFIEAIELSNLSRKIRVYVPQGSVLRKKLLDDPSITYEGIINGVSVDDVFIVQGNSVNEIVDWEDGMEDIHEYKVFDDEYDWQKWCAIINNNNCAYCSDPLSVVDNHVIVSNDTVFCETCASLEEVKQFLPN